MNHGAELQKKLEEIFAWNVSRTDEEKAAHFAKYPLSEKRYDGILHPGDWLGGK